MARTRPPLPVRIVRAYRRGGIDYLYYKAVLRGLAWSPGLQRRLLCHDPRWYWTVRGGPDYFREQEDQPGRSLRSRFIAAQIARYRPSSVLEIGCGYGKQLRSIRQVLDVPLTGVDYSLSQLRQARSYLAGVRDVHLALAAGQRLPFADASFDLVLTSAVILHNPPTDAERIRREVCRVGRCFAVHNEDTDRSFSRYGYDTAAIYRRQGYQVVECRPIPGVADADSSQFCVVDLGR